MKIYIFFSITLYNKGKAVRFQRLFLGFTVFCYNDYLWNPFFFVSIYTILLCLHFGKQNSVIIQCLSGTDCKLL